MIDWDIDILALQDQTLIGYLYKIVDLFGLIDELAIDTDKFKRFIQAVYLNYHKNPYHNFKHAYCVTAGTANFLRYGFAGFANDYWNPVETMSLMVASLCHDVGHMAFNNDYY